MKMETRMNTTDSLRSPLVVLLGLGICLMISGCVPQRAGLVCGLGTIQVPQSPPRNSDKLDPPASDVCLPDAASVCGEGTIAVPLDGPGRVSDFECRPVG